MYTDDSTVYGPETSTDQLSLLMLNEWLDAVKDAFIIFPLKKRGDKTVIIISIFVAFKIKIRILIIL